jgi:putative 4-mercaptohistidine N1-methyltranferase
MANPYESDRYLAEYLLFHYGSAAEILPWDFGPAGALDFPARTAALADACGDWQGPRARALDLGCAVGRSSFELARRFDSVVGLDFSRRFIDAATALRDGEAIRYERADEGGLTTWLEARWCEPAIAARVEFVQGDAMDLPAGWREFDLVHAANLLCRLPDPMRLITRLPCLVRPGGLLVLATPCTWLDDFTPRACWLGGFNEQGTAVRTIDRLRAVLAADFEEVAIRDEPFLIREHARKFQWSVALASVWRRRGQAPHS